MKKHLTLYLILIALVSPAQNPKIDSLLQALKNYDAKKLELHQNLLPDENDTTKVNIQIGLGRELNQVSDYDAAKRNADEALAIAQQINYKKGIANSHSLIGIIHWYKGNYPEALKNHFASLKIREETGDKSGIAASYANIGVVYKAQGNYPEALKNHFASLKIREEIGDKNGIAASDNNIGNIYQRQQKYPEALKYFIASLKIREETGDRKGIASSKTSIADIYARQGNQPEALKNYFAALKIREEDGDKNLIAAIYNNIGNIYDMTGNYPEAVKNYSAALKLYLEIGNKNDVANTSINMGATKVAMGAAMEGKALLMNGLMLAKEIGAADLIRDGYDFLAEADNALGNFKGAYENHKLFILYRDSLTNEENTKKQIQTEMQYEFDKIQIADSVKFAQEKEVAAIKLQKQKAIAYGGFAGAAITIILLFFVYRNYSKQRIANQKLKEAQEQLIKSEKMAAFGMMASRVSHEIQNPLNFVNNFSDLAEEMVNDIVKLNNEQERSETAKDLINNLQKIKHHGMRADAIVKQLQEHTNKGTAHEYFEAKQQ